MKHTTYIICIAILALLILVQDGFIISNNRIISTQRDSTAYWKGRYDSVAQKDEQALFNELIKQQPYKITQPASYLKDSIAYTKTGDDGHSIIKTGEYIYEWSSVTCDILKKYTLIPTDSTYQHFTLSEWHYFDGHPQMDTLRTDSIILPTILEVKSKYRGRTYSRPVRFTGSDTSLIVDSIPIRNSGSIQPIKWDSCIMDDFAFISSGDLNRNEIRMYRDSTIRIKGDTLAAIRYTLEYLMSTSKENGKYRDELRKAKVLLYNILLRKYYPETQIKFCK